MHNAAIALINSEHRRDGDVNDRLDDEKWMDRFLAQANLSQPLSQNQLLRLRELRALLRRIVEQISSERAISDRALKELNGFLEPLTARESIARSDTGFIRKSVFTGQAYVTAVIAREFLKLLVDGEWQRLKVCANATCRWAFYDASRNRVRLWCDSTRCGNVMKVRRFRERNRG